MPRNLIERFIVALDPWRSGLATRSVQSRAGVSPALFQIDAGRLLVDDSATTRANPYVPVNSPAVGDLWDLFDFDD